MILCEKRERFPILVKNEMLTSDWQFAHMSLANGPHVVECIIICERFLH